MHPVIFRLGPLTVSSYGLLLGLSLILGLWLSYIRAGKMGLKRHLVIDAAFWVVLTAMICARLYYVVLNTAEFRGASRGRLVSFLGLGGGLQGLLVTGGFMGGILACWIFFRFKRLSFLAYADVFAPSFVLGVFITRIGCFLNGCCFGLPTRSGLGVHFPPRSPAGEYQALMNAPRLLPTQLFLSAGGLLIFGLALIATRRRTFPGFAFFLTGIAYAALTFFVDFFRFYPASEKISSLSWTQVFSLILFAAFLAFMVAGFHRFRHPGRNSARCR